MVSRIGNGFNPAVATRGNELLLCWEDSSNGISGIRVANTGIPFGNALQLIKTPIKQSNPTVAFSSKNDAYLVIARQGTSETSSLTSRLLNSSGALLPTSGATIFSSALGRQAAPKAESCGDKHVGFFLDDRESTNGTAIYWHEVGPDGKLLGPTSATNNPLFTNVNPAMSSANDLSASCGDDAWNLFLAWIYTDGDGTHGIRGAFSTQDLLR